MQKAQGLWPVVQVAPTAHDGQLSALLGPSQATVSWVSKMGLLIPTTSSGCVSMKLGHAYQARVLDKKRLRVAASPLALLGKWYKKELLP